VHLVINHQVVRPARSANAKRFCHLGRLLFMAGDVDIITGSESPRVCVEKLKDHCIDP
jgi:hypothetical protein